MREEERSYRVFEPDGSDLVPFRAKVDTTDLYIKAVRELKNEAMAAAKTARLLISDHGRERPEFLTGLSPLDEPAGLAPLLSAMYRATRAAGVGPMAAVAGAVAQYVAESLKPLSTRILVENGGDIYIDDTRPVSVGIFAGKSIFSGRIAIELEVDRLPLSVCTSSGTVGPSLSFGKADAATVIAKDASLADAVASGLGNRINSPDDLGAALKWACEIEGVEGVLAIIGDKLGCLGNLKLSKLE